MKHFLTFFIACTSLIGLAQDNVRLQDSVVGLDEVVLEIQSAAVSPLGIVPSEVITEQALAMQNPLDFASALNQVPGIFLLSGALNTNRITIRGVGSRTGYGTNKLRMYYNDIPVTDGSGFSSFESFDLEDLGSIRVIKGPKAGAYGAAMGGAILLRSDPRKTEGAMLRNRVSAGSYGLFKNNLSLTFKEGNVNGEVRYNRLTTQGYRENNAFDRDGLLLNLSWQPHPAHHLNLLSQYINYRAEIPSSISQTAFETDPTQAAFTWAQSKGYEANKYLLTGISDRITLSDNLENTSSVFISYLDHYEPRPFNILDEYTMGLGMRSVFKGTLGSGKRVPKFTAGGEFFRDRYTWSTYQNNYTLSEGQGSVQGDVLSRNLEYRNQLFIFGSLEIPLSDGLMLGGGLSVNKTQYDYRDLFGVGDANTSANRSFDPILMPNLDLRYSWNNESFVFLNVSRGFNNPSLEESLTPDGQVNPDIAQEKGVNYEIGGSLTAAGGRLLLSGSLYRMDIRDLLVADRVGDDQYIGRNAGSTKQQGLELSVQYRQSIGSRTEIIPFISLTLNDHSFRDFEDAGIDYSGNRLTGVPASRLYAGLRIRGDAGWYWNSSFQFVDRIPLTDGNTPYSEAYSLVNMQLGYNLALGPRLSAGIELGIQNVLDTLYAGSVLINATGFRGAEPRYFYPGNGRNSYLGFLMLYNL